MARVAGLPLLVSFGLFWLTYGRIQPAEQVFPTDINKAFMPTVRQTLNDCHLRYHKYGDFYLVYPIYGVPARRGEFAHMAAIGWRRNNGSIRFDCGGSLITPRHVMTAAHCALNDEGVAPQVVRLGVIDITAGLYDPENQFAQEHGIESFRRHPLHEFRSEYHDIALVTLDRTVTLTSAVAPACLWTGAQVPQRRLEAAGFGQTSFAGENTPILLKVQLSPVDNAVCSRSYPAGRRRRQGLIEQQLCAVDERMDTCQGDSGGPLQIKLMANNRLVPFVTGITSFGRFCGTATPAVYTRVSSYVEWMQTETGVSFDARACAARHLNVREIEEAMVANRIGDNLFIEPERSYMDLETVAKHRVYLGYSTSTSRIQWNCGGVLINENYVLTVAHCDRFVLNKTPDYVKLGDLDIFKDHPHAQIIRIAQFIKHPEYRSGGSLDNDIALVKLQTNVRFQPNVVPACILNSEAVTLPFYEMAGLGPFNMNNFVMDDEPVSDNSTLVLTRMRADSSTCSIQTTNKLMCTRNSQSLVPGTCRIEHGGPLEREIWHHDRYYSYVFGLTVAGDDCGFGSDAYYVKVASHIKWIEQTVLGTGTRPVQKRSGRTKRQIWFPNSGEDYGTATEPQSCLLPDGRRGSCKRYGACSKDVVGMVISICQHSLEPVICCPSPYASTRPTRQSQTTNLSASQNGYKLNSCVSFWKQYSRPPVEEFEHIPSEGRTVAADEYPHVAAIGNAQQNAWPCTGVLVSDLHVLSAASCLASARSVTSVRMGSGSSSANTYRISEIKNHPSYGGRTAHLYNLALVRLTDRVRFSASVLPACLWTKTDMVPLKLYALGIGAGGQTFVYPRSAMYNADCRVLPGVVNSIQDEENVCIENYFTTDTTCTSQPGYPVEGIVEYSGIRIPLIVGTTSYNIGCVPSQKTQTATILSRVAAHMTWIKSVVER